MKITNNPPIKRDGCTRYISTLEDEPYLTDENRLKRKFVFLREICNDGMFRGLLNCGPFGFDKLNMYDNGTSWVIKLEAEVYE